LPILSKISRISSLKGFLNFLRESREVYSSESIVTSRLGKVSIFISPTSEEDSKNFRKISGLGSYESIGEEFGELSLILMHMILLTIQQQVHSIYRIGIERCSTWRYHNWQNFH
jgi:hypothetical protein